MKRLVIFGIIIAISNIISPIKGQTYSYYQTTQSYEREGYTYQCDVSPYKFVTLYNKENTLTYEKIVYKSTQKVFDQEYFRYPKVVEDDEAMCKKAWYIVNDAFTREEARIFNNEGLIFTLCLDSETGKVREVYFEFLTMTPYAQFPVERYREIEMKLKTEVQFVPSEIGKQLNYIMMSCRIEPTGRRELEDPTYIGDPIVP